VSRENVFIVLFTFFAIGLPLWAMDANKFDKHSVHGCTGDCYAAWQQETGGFLAMTAAQAAEKASASPTERGEQIYAGCVACHGSGGEGGVGPSLAGQTGDAIYSKLLQYKNGETRGPQSALMWAQAGTLSDEDMKNIGAFVESLPAQ
jgi:cytochrome c553